LTTLLLDIIQDQVQYFFSIYLYLSRKHNTHYSNHIQQTGQWDRNSTKHCPYISLLSETTEPSKNIKKLRKYLLLTLVHYIHYSYM